MPYDLVIKNGTVVTSSETLDCDVGITGERITALGSGLPGKKEIDAAGKLVIPGGVDIHVTGMMKFDQDRLATLEASFIAGLQQTYTVVGENGVLEMPHDAFIPWEKDTLYMLRENDVETGTPTVVSGADEYQLMVEHFADAALGLVSPEYSPADSVGNMRVLDALSAAARNGDAVSI